MITIALEKLAGENSIGKTGKKITEIAKIIPT
jgi:hypothetical protein